MEENAIQAVEALINKPTQREGVDLGCPTVKDLIEILSKVPEDYKVTCCGVGIYLHAYNLDRYITLDTEEVL